MVEVGGSNPLSRTKIILTSLNKLYLRIPICTNVAQLVSALPTLYAHAEIGGSNSLSRTKFILTSLNKLYLRIPICTTVTQLVSPLPTLNPN